MTGSTDGIGKAVAEEVRLFKALRHHDAWKSLFYWNCTLVLESMFLISMPTWSFYGIVNFKVKYVEQYTYISQDKYCNLSLYYNDTIKTLTINGLIFTER